MKMRTYARVDGFLAPKSADYLPRFSLVYPGAKERVCRASTKRNLLRSKFTGFHAFTKISQLHFHTF